MMAPNAVPDASPAPLAVAVVLEAQGCAEWIACVLADLCAGPSARLVALRREPASASPPLSPFLAYAAQDQARVAQAPDPMAFVPFADLLARLPVLASVPEAPAQPADVVLDFGHGAAEPAACGVWSFRFGDARPVLAGETYFAELTGGATSCALTLRAERADGTSVVLAASQCHVNDLSLWRTRAPVAWKARALVRRALQRLQQRGPAAFCSAHWARGFRFIEAPFDRFFADPFLFVHQGQTWLFVEDWDWAVGKAIISAAPVREDLTLGPLVTVLETPYHLSNPLVFAEGGEIFLIPETLAMRRVEVYRCVSFPDQWTLHCVPLDDIDIADACVLKDGDAWWMCAAVQDFGGNGWDELHLFRAPALCGPWTPHPDNPVVSDVRAARPGGRMWMENGRLHRLVQDCAGRYGSGLGIFQTVPALDAPYVQDQCAVLNSFDFAMNGVHAYDAAGGIEAVDGRQYQVALGRFRADWPFPRWFGRH
ncbi:MAG: hypothetical protein B7Z15_03175 [Rhizobiales bacterium 32-66-8]|nr:MAG: hypothetical protein B7Z15_03175 [Rhizobiales bacterium 32-66-8]